MNAAATPTGAIIRVLLVGSQPVSLAGLRALIDHEDGFAVVGQREHPRDAHDALAPVPAPADVALIDHEARDSVEPLTTLAQGGTGHPPCVLLTNSTDSALLSDAFRVGARGLVFKHQSPSMLIDAIACVHAGEVWLDRSATTRLITDLLRPTNGTPGNKKPTLSKRDHRIIALVAEGQTNHQVADALCVSEATVRNQLTGIFKKLRLKGRMQLVVYACQKGLVKLPRDGMRPNAEGKLRLV